VTGRWELLAWRSLGGDGAVAGQPFGEHPHGVLIYTPGGWMAAGSRGDHSQRAELAADGILVNAGPFSQARRS
jgi:hypothetical protein